MTTIGCRIDQAPVFALTLPTADRALAATCTSWTMELKTRGASGDPQVITGGSYNSSTGAVTISMTAAEVATAGVGIWGFDLLGYVSSTLKGWWPGTLTITDDMGT